MIDHYFLGTRGMLRQTALFLKEVKVSQEKNKQEADAIALSSIQDWRAPHTAEMLPSQ